MIFKIKRRPKLTKVQIWQYYRSGKVATAMGSASFQQVVLRDFYEFLKRYCHSEISTPVILSAAKNLFRVSSRSFVESDSTQDDRWDLKKWRVLEFGVGNGLNLPLQVKYFGKITGVDVAQAAIAQSKKYGFKNVHLKVVGNGKLPFADNTFDLIVATEVLEHVADLNFTARELKRITKPQGFILVSVPTYLNLRALSKKIMELVLGEGAWEPARSHPGGYERFLTPGKIRSYFESSRNKPSSFRRYKIWLAQGADYGTAWSLPMIPFYPQKFAPFFEVTLGKMPIIKNFGMNYYFLAQKT